MIDRRGFLRLFGAAAAAAVLDPERLLWVPGQKTIFLPSVEVFHGGDLAAIDAILKQHYEGYVVAAINQRSPFFDTLPASAADDDYIVLNVRPT